MTDITSIGDIGTPEQHARGLLRKVIRNGKVIAEVRPSVHGGMLNRGYISHVQHAAGEELWKHTKARMDTKDAKPGREQAVVSRITWLIAN